MTCSISVACAECGVGMDCVCEAETIEEFLGIQEIDSKGPLWAWERLKQLEAHITSLPCIECLGHCVRLVTSPLLEPVYPIKDCPKCHGEAREKIPLDPYNED